MSQRFYHTETFAFLFFHEFSRLAQADTLLGYVGWPRETSNVVVGPFRALALLRESKLSGTDGSFIRDIVDNQISESMVVAIAQVAKVMELETVAEYVENKATIKVITDLGVDFAQGHAVGKPTPLETVLEGLSKETQSA